jgi:RNA polymerase sigma-70 factor (ECF subfamily)
MEDEELIAAAARGDAEAFSALYAAYERPVAGWFVRATGSGELAADLTAETFAEVVASLRRFDAGRGSARGWLYGIARNVLARSRERGVIEDRARRRLGLPVLALDDDAIEAIEASAAAESLLAALPEDQRIAVDAHVVQERSYAEIAATLRCSESVVRKRVSRGLAALRTVVERERS